MSRRHQRCQAYCYWKNLPNGWARHWPSEPPGVDVVGWSQETGYRRNGEPVDPATLTPDVGWVNGEVFAARCMKAYADELLKFPTMRWVQSANAGLDNPIYPALARAGVRICKSGAQSIPITEFVLGHVLAHFQGVLDRREAQDLKEWRPRRFREIWHTNWLIVGYGHIGRGVAQRARAFDCPITVIRQRQDRDEYIDTVAPLSAIDQHLADADVVVLACPATDETRGLVDAGFLGQMKSGSVLVNVARGSLVDESALLAALDDGPLEHAVLDVFQTEPLPEDSPLWSHPGVTVAAHTSNAGDGTRGRGDTLFLDNLTRYLAGADLNDEVDLSGLEA